MELHTRSTEANGFDGIARLGRTGHKERTLWLVGYLSSKGWDELERLLETARTYRQRLVHEEIDQRQIPGWEATNGGYQGVRQANIGAYEQ